jgi:hypothetical protein
MKLQKLSLFGVVVGALIFTAALAPRANASLIVYYNFEDAVGAGASPANDFTAEGLPEITTNQQPTLQTNFTHTFNNNGLSLNIASGDPDTPSAFSLGDSHSKDDNGKWIQFHVNTTLVTNMSLSFAANTAGNGFATVAFSYSTDGTTFTSVGSATALSTSGSTITFTVPVGAEGQPDVIFRLTFDGATSNGNNAQNAIDNIQLGGTVVPEPATVVGGLLGACALCWHQRRRLIRSLRLRRA